MAEEKLLGMYEAPINGLQVGEFNLRHQRQGIVWIEREGGEGGEFDEAQLAEAVRMFYEANF